MDAGDFAIGATILLAFLGGYFLVSWIFRIVAEQRQPPFHGDLGRVAGAPQSRSNKGVERDASHASHRDDQHPADDPEDAAGDIQNPQRVKTDRSDIG